jgi:hypothetical protein
MNFWQINGKLRQKMLAELVQKKLVSRTGRRTRGFRRRGAWCWMASET